MPSDYETLQVAVVSTTPGNDSNTYSLFNSTVTFGVAIDGDARNATLKAHDISRVEVRLANNAAGTIKAYSSINKGTNWDQVQGDIAVAASGSTDINGPYDFLVDPYTDFKIDWVNGGSAQTTWRPQVSLIRGSRPAAV